LFENHVHGASELALTGIEAGEVVSIVIDRTFVAADGTRWIVDYKTSVHEGAGLAEFLDSEVLRYREQLARYARLLRLWTQNDTGQSVERIHLGLYFPLLGAWREWPAD
jgi:ATP-dependent exoDNAse (exonuclease V) beta subunit